jgi:hypothetical protein
MQAHFGTHAWQCFGQEVGRSLHALRVPKGCSTVWRLIREAFGVRSSRFCIASSTSSCSQRVMRRYWLVVHCALIAHLKQAEVQYLWIVGRITATAMPPLREIVSTHESIRHGSKGDGAMELATRTRSRIVARLVTIIFLSGVLACWRAMPKTYYPPRAWRFRMALAAEKVTAGCTC